MNTVDFEKQTASALKDCPAGTTFLAAVSGGADSMAMLTALSTVVNKEQIFCLHVEHGLRPEEESSGDAEFVRHYCKKSGIRCCIVSIPRGKIVSFAQRKGTGVEAAARLFRHRALLKEALRQGNNTRILIAHTKDDALELALMRILRGAGSPGLAAMPVKKGRIIRPLLSISRADVIDYLSEKKISWREDSTNTDVVFLRNRIRQQLVPVLNDSFPSWKKGLACMGETQLLTAAFLVKEAQTRVCWKTRKSSAQKTERFPVLFTDAGNFFSQPQIIREEALFQGIDSYSKALMQKHRGKKHDSVKRSA
ncbi:MAG: tRNA lysidine(34) synthetase TilS, partial [Treponema sp.]|nr:tRNA lysidine(34) synthetase TilS [Treponema sp.]